jgi:hypothetical protein
LLPTFARRKSPSNGTVKKNHLVGGLEHFLFFHIRGWVKTLVPSEPQNSWDLWMFIPLKMVLIGIDP